MLETVTSHLKKEKTDLYRAIVSGFSPPLKISWLHLSCFAIKLAFESFGNVAIGMNVERLATAISRAFKLAFKFVSKYSRPHDVTN